MTEPRDRRRHPRKEVDIPVELLLPAGRRIQARLGQMSIGGSFIETTEVQAFGVELKLLFRVPGKPTEFAVSAVVRWLSPNGMGVQFGAMRAREIYELSQFLVDKPSVPPAAPVTRPPRLGLPQDKGVGGATDAPAHAAPTSDVPPVAAKPAVPAPAAPRAAAPAPAAPSVRTDAPAKKPADPAATESELDRARCEIERLALELVEAQDRLEHAEAERLERAEKQRYAEAELALRNEQLRKVAPERAQREERLRIVEAELALRSEQLRKLATEVGQRDQQGQQAVAELAQRQARLQESEVELVRREAELAQREVELVRREAELAQLVDAEPDARLTGDDLTRIRGIGRAFERALQRLGVSRFAQIAAWTEADVETIAAQLKLASARIRRQEWIKQAAALAGPAGGVG